MARPVPMGFFLPRTLPVPEAGEGQLNFWPVLAPEFYETQAKISMYCPGAPDEADGAVAVAWGGAAGGVAIPSSDF